MSINLLLAKETEDSLPFGRLATQRKSLRKFNLRPLATTCRSVWPGLYKSCFPTPKSGERTNRISDSTFWAEPCRRDEWKKHLTSADVWSQDQRFAHRNGTWKSNVFFCKFYNLSKSFRSVRHMGHIYTADIFILLKLIKAKRHLFSSRGEIITTLNALRQGKYN